MEKCYEHSKDLHMLIVYKQAFDSVLRKHMEQKRISAKLIRLIRMTIKKRECNSKL
jgi:hypothetical protein